MQHKYSQPTAHAASDLVTLSFTDKENNVDRSLFNSWLRIWNRARCCYEVEEYKAEYNETSKTVKQFLHLLTALTILDPSVPNDPITAG